MFTIIKKGDFTKRVAKHIANGNAFKTEAHLLAQNAVLHVFDHGDITDQRKLVSGMDHLSHDNAMRRWFDQYGKGIVQWNSAAKEFDVNTKALQAIKETDNARDNLIEMLSNAKPYYELTSQPKFTPFILVNELAKIISKAEKRKAEGHEEDNFEGLDKLMNALKNIDQVKAAEVMSKTPAASSTVVTH